MPVACVEIRDRRLIAVVLHLRAHSPWPGHPHWLAGLEESLRAVCAAHSPALPDVHRVLVHQQGVWHCLCKGVPLQPRVAVLCWWPLPQTCLVHAQRLPAEVILTHDMLGAESVPSTSGAESMTGSSGGNTKPLLSEVSSPSGPGSIIVSPAKGTGTPSPPTAPAGGNKVLKLTTFIDSEGVVVCKDYLPPALRDDVDMPVTSPLGMEIVPSPNDMRGYAGRNGDVITENAGVYRSSVVVPMNDVREAKGEAPPVPVLSQPPRVSTTDAPVSIRQSSRRQLSVTAARTSLNTTGKSAGVV